MNKLEKFFFSTRTMAVLLLIYAISMAVGTFVENDYGTPASKVLVYNAKWFEVLMLWLIILFIVNIPRYQLYKKEKWPLLIFHLSFVLIFIGAGVTRYISFEGNMPIPEGQTSNEIITYDTYFKLQVNKDGKDFRQYDKGKYIISEFDEKDTSWPFKRQFKSKYNYNGQEIQLKTLDYIPHAQDTIIESLKEGKLLELVTVGGNGRETVRLEEGDIKQVGQLIVSFNNQTAKAIGSVQIFEENGNLKIRSPFKGEYISMAGQQVGVVSDSTALENSRGTLEFNQASPLNVRTLYTIQGSQFVMPNLPKNARFEYTKGDRKNPKEKESPDAIVLEVSSENEKDTVTIIGGKGVTGFDKNIELAGLNIALGFGSKAVKTPFGIKLRDFQLDRYPGSLNASSYASEISIIDDGKETDYRIFMNNILDHKGYRFFQSSYFPNEQGTILSVNKDRLGTNITYLGYFMLFFGLAVTLFWKGTRFWKLNKRLKDLSKKSLVLLPLFLSGFAFAQHDSKTTIPELNQDSLIKAYKINDKHEALFGKLLIQDNQGRIKPINTYALELLRKITRKDNSFKGLSATEWFLGMNTAQSDFGRLPMLKVGDKGGSVLKNKTKANEDGYTSLINLLKLNEKGLPYFALEQDYAKSFSKRDADKSEYDKEIVNVTERFQIAQGILEEQYLKIFPIKNDIENTWSSGFYFVPNDSLASGYSVEINKEGLDFWSLYKKEFKKAQLTNDWTKANAVVQKISEHQKKWGANVLPDQVKIDWEVRYNQLNIFFVCMILYTTFGGLLLILAFIQLFKENKLFNWLINIVLGFIFLTFLFQAFGLILRWYISGHAPWSNGYEAIMFVCWVGVFSGLLLYRNRNAFIPAAGCIVAMIMMGFAHGGDLLNPQITPLVPVLKSYWLMIHVGIIVSSYGFLGIGAILSLIALVFITIQNRKNKTKIKKSLKEITIVSEMALTVGLFTLTVGTFLGGMWANESWGRYWSWDPKETWAFISIIIYAFVLHMRLVPGLRGFWAYNTASMFAIWTIVMTYFGVNHFLSGLHSYAAGDSVPIHYTVYLSAAIMFILAFSSFYINQINSKIDS